MSKIFVYMKIQLKIASETTDFSVPILAFFAFGGTSFVKTLNETSFHMQSMVRFEGEILPVWVGFL